MTVSRALTYRGKGSLPLIVLVLSLILVLLTPGLYKEICFKRSGECSGLPYTFPRLFGLVKLIGRFSSVQVTLWEG